MARAVVAGPLLLLHPDFRAVLHSSIAPGANLDEVRPPVNSLHRECGRISLSVISHVIS